MPLLTRSQAKTQLVIPLSDTSRDDELQLWMDATRSAVEKARGEVTDTRLCTDEADFGTGGATSFVLSNVPVIAITSVAAADGSQTWDPANLHVNPATGLVTVMSGAPIRGLVAVVSTAGYAECPANYTAAALIILQHLWETKRGAQGVPRGGSDDMFVPALGFAVPRRAVELLGLTLPGVA